MRKKERKKERKTERKTERKKERKIERKKETELHPSPFPLIRRNSSNSLILPLFHFNLSSLEKGSKWVRERVRVRDLKRVRESLRE